MADFNELKAAIRAAIYENEDQAITGDALQEVLLEMVTDINAAKQDALTPRSPLGFNSNGALILNYSGHGITLDQDGNLGVEAGYGLDFVDSTLVVATGDGIGIDDNGALQVLASRGIYLGGNGIEANIGWGLTWGGEAEDEIAVDDTEVQPIISDLATIRSGAAAGATAVQPADVSDCVRSASVSTIVTLSQAEYDALADKDANTFYVII